MTPCSCTVSSSRFDAPSRLPAEVVLLGGAIALREREEAAPERMADQLQQHEQVARPVRQRRAGQEIDGRLPRRVRRGLSSELPRELAAGARVVLQVVRLVEHEPRPRHASEGAHVLRQDVVVHDRPFAASASRRRARCLRRRATDAPGAAPARSRAPSCASPMRGRRRDTARRGPRGGARRSPAASCRAPCRRRGWRGGGRAGTRRLRSDAGRVPRRAPTACRKAPSMSFGASAEELREGGGLCVESLIHDLRRILQGPNDPPRKSH